MLSKLNEFIINCSLSWQKTLLLISGFAVTMWQLQAVTGRFPAISGGHTPFDMQNSLTSEQVYTQLSTYTDAAFNDYLWFQFVDFFFPLFGGLMMAALCAFAIRTLSDNFYHLATRRKLFLLFLVPTLFDWLENIGFLLVIGIWPETSEAAATFGVTAKKLKLITLFITQPVALLLLLAGTLKWLWQRINPALR